MNEKEAVPRRGRLRARHLFFAAAIVVFVAGILLAVSVKPRTMYEGGSASRTSGGVVLPYRPGFPVTDSRTPLRVGLGFGGAAFALVLAGVGLAVDRR